jgi:polysaccharide pyruvyl transferase WcaK-like protein
MHKNERLTPRIAFFGHFDSTNFGNESSLQAMLFNLRRFKPDATILCISSGPEATSATHRIRAIPISETLIKFSIPRHLLTRILYRIFIGVPTEAYRWIHGLLRLRHTDMLIVPGTGLLTDAYGLVGWGPYTLLRWALIAKLCGCKVFVVSVGAGPIYSVLGRCFVRLILSLAAFRSYRDHTTLQYLESIGLRTSNDRVFPDLAFSLPEDLIPGTNRVKHRRRVIGVGVMRYPGKYSIENPTDRTHINYLEALVKFVQWLLARGYKIRLLIGDLDDIETSRQFRELLSKRISLYDNEHIVAEPICSVDDLLSEIAKTDIVVATRFHNVLLSLICIKPVISVAFHHKCKSLMAVMGLSQYCVDIDDLTTEDLINRFCDVEANYDNIKTLITAKTKESREALDRQYERIFGDL